MLGNQETHELPGQLFFPRQRRGKREKVCDVRGVFAGVPASYVRLSVATHCCQDVTPTCFHCI